MVTPRHPELVELLATIDEQAALIDELRGELATAHELIAELERRLGEGARESRRSS